MNKFILAAPLLTLCVAAAEARDISAGTIMITGDTKIDIGSNEIKNSTGTTTTDKTEVNLASLYFLSDNFGAGLLMNNDQTKVDDGAKKTKETLSMIGPIAGYNFSVNSNSSILLHASIFNVSGDVDDGAGFKADIDGHGYMLGGIFNYFLNDRVAVNFGLRWIKADVDYSFSGTSISSDMKETGATIGLAAFF